METIRDLKDMVQLVHDKVQSIQTRVNNLVNHESKNSEHIRAVQEDINQLYLLFNELLRSNKKEKDDA